MKKYYLICLIWILLLSGCGGGKNMSKFEPEKNSKEISENVVVRDEQKDHILVEEQEFDPILHLANDKENFEKNVPVLMFHYIRDLPESTSDQLGYRLSFSPEKLEQALAYLERNHIQTLTFWDLKDILENKKPFPEKAVMLTFDDGYMDQYQNAFHLLEKYHMKGVFFIISGKPDKDSNYATWNEIEEMSKAGQEIGSHSVNHLDLAELPDEKIQYEVSESKKTIENHIGKPVISFCYPSGKYDERVVHIVQSNYLYARTTKSGHIFSTEKRWEIPTIRMLPETDVASIKSINDRER